MFDSYFVDYYSIIKKFEDLEELNYEKIYLNLEKIIVLYETKGKG